MKFTLQKKYNFFIVLIALCACEKTNFQFTDTSTYSAIEDQYLQRNSINDKEEIVFTYITSPACALCTQSETFENVIKLKNLLKEKADSLDLGYLALAVVISWDVDEGYNHLKNFGKFDEILIGNNWFGTGGIKYLFEEIPGRPGVPQILLTKRIYNAEVDESGMIQSMSGVETEVEITRKVGTNNIEKWLEEKARLPNDF